MRLWVIETSLFSDVPYLKEYEAVRVSKPGRGSVNATVIILGQKKVIPYAANRHFFTDEKEMKVFLVDLIGTSIDRHRKSIDRLNKALNEGVMFEIVSAKPFRVSDVKF